MFFDKLKSFTRDYFTLTSRERKGALSLGVLIILQSGYIYYLNYFSDAGYAEFSKLKVSAIQLEEIQNKAAEKKESLNNENVPLTISNQPFDPNLISEKEWLSYGLTVKQASIIKNYINKGGRFRKKGDLAKMYCISETLFNKLSPLIVFTEIEKRAVYASPRRETKKVVMVNLNVADTIELEKLPLVSAGRARMIYKYRESLGGFHDIKQLMEVFTIDSTVFNALKPLLIVDSTLVRKINVNSDELRHPYISKTLAYAIKAYRRQHGNFKDIIELRKLALVDDQLYGKLAPYVVIE
jgi:competence protein ComEA